MTSLEQRLANRQQILDDTLEDFGEAIIDALQRGIDTVPEVSDTQHLVSPEGLKTYDELLADTLVPLAEHERQRNPHRVSSAQLGALSREQFDALLRSYIPTRLNPFSFFIYETKNYVFSNSNRRVDITYTNVKVCLSGRYWELPELIVGGGSIGTNYIYLELSAGKPVLKIVTVLLKESYRRMMVSMILSDSTIKHLDTNNAIFRIDNGRLTGPTTSNIGSGIPTSQRDTPLAGDSLIWT